MRVYKERIFTALPCYRHFWSICTGTLLGICVFVRYGLFSNEWQKNRTKLSLLLKAGGKQFQNRSARTLQGEMASAIFRVLISSSCLWPCGHNMAALAPDITHTSKVGKTKGKGEMPGNKRLFCVHCLVMQQDLFKNVTWWLENPGQLFPRGWGVKGVVLAKFYLVLVTWMLALWEFIKLHICFLGVSV